MPIKARTAMPPITAPTIRPVDGPELSGSEDVEGDVDGNGDKESEVDVVPLEAAKERKDVDSLLLAEPVVSLVLAVTTAVEDVAAADVVGGATDCTTLKIADVMTAVGMVTSALDRIELTSPAMLDSMLPICLRCSRCSRCVVSARVLRTA